MLDQALHSLAFALGAPAARGCIRSTPDDFQVDELPLVTPSGDGEHAWLNIRKRGLTTPDVVDRLSRHAGVHPRTIGYAGLKDRHAVTTQWFSVQLPGRDAPDWHLLDDENLTVLQATRHARKLQRGTLAGNRFRITVRDVVGNYADIEQRFERIAECGVPNYFGAQRFGREGSNLQTAARLFANPRLRLSRNQRSMALSSARSLLFNQVLSARILAGNWDTPVAGDAMQLAGSHSFFIADTVDDALQERAREQDIHPTGPLCGRGDTPVRADSLAIEQRVLAAHKGMVDGLDAAGVRHDRRALRVTLGEPVLERAGDDALVLSFGLPAGSYATAVLRELVDHD